MRLNRLHPTTTPRLHYLHEQIAETNAPFIAATDYQKAHTDQLREFIPGAFSVLGTDGFGRSDTRQQLRQHFEVSREHIVLAAMKALADQGELEAKRVDEALTQLGIDSDKPNPTHL